MIHPQNAFYPQVIEQTARGEIHYDLFSRLLKDRIIFLGEPIGEVVANIVIGQLLYLDADDPERDIQLYINSPGGNVSAGLAIYDTMQHLKSDVATICIGQAASMAAILLASGAPKKRHSLPHSRIILHQPMGGVTGQTSDIEIQAKELTRNRDILNNILVKHTNRDLDTIRTDTDRDFYMTAEEAQEYGVVDTVLVSREETDKK